MALISVQYVATALGVTFTSDQQNKVAQLVDEVSEYVEDITGQEFLNTNYYSCVPKTIEGVVSRAVIRGFLSEPSNLKTLTVGDVTEVYGDMYDFSTSDQRILDLAGGSAYTIHLDGRDCFG